MFLGKGVQQLYRRTPIPKCDFNKVAKQSNFIEIAIRHRIRNRNPVNLLHIFRTPFPKNISVRLLLALEFQVSIRQYQHLMLTIKFIEWYYFADLIYVSSSANIYQPQNTFSVEKNSHYIDFHLLNSLAFLIKLFSVQNNRDKM